MATTRLYSDMLELGSSGYDADLVGIGSGPDGFPSSTTIDIPEEPTTAKNLRYLVLLATHHVPARTKAIVRYIRQAILIGPPRRQGEAPLLLQVTSPFWRFADGNVLWGLRILPPYLFHENSNPPQAFPTPAGYSSGGLYATAPGILFAPGTDPNTAYVPPSGGDFPGDPLGGSYGRFNEIRTPWAISGLPQGIVVNGECYVQLFASVWQTDPETRAPLPNIPRDAMSPEDRLVSAAPETIYRKIAGTLTIDFLGDVDRGCVAPTSDGGPGREPSIVPERSP